MEISPRLVRAPNPSPLTGAGTNSYLVGRGQVAVIDPGPDMDTHLRAILDALAPDETISHIFVTHSHLDHSALSRRLSRATGAAVYALGDSAEGRRDENLTLGNIGGGEGVDHAFAPDNLLEDGGVIQGAGWAIKALWTPGHFGNHMCFEWADTLFSGDLVMGWATTLVSPPDGDMSDYLASLARLMALDHRCYFPGHGEVISDPSARLSWLWAHRHRREAQILAALGDGAHDTAALTAKIYTDVARALHPAAARNVLAHLIDLTRQNKVKPEGTLYRPRGFISSSQRPPCP